jgi:hypothetical protein
MKHQKEDEAEWKRISGFLSGSVVYNQKLVKMMILAGFKTTKTQLNL